MRPSGLPVAGPIHANRTPIARRSHADRMPLRKRFFTWAWIVLHHAPQIMNRKMKPRRLKFSACCQNAAMFAGLCALPALVSAQDAGPPAPAPAAAPEPQEKQPTRLAPVEVRGSSTDDTQLRRNSTAGKITIGREEIERYGDSSAVDLLRRLPGVTLQGRPGRGGNISMRGLGSGYTQILLDGERVPRGFSIDSISPEQIERIEIQRAPTAETGARAIAGTINIVTREGFTKKLNDLRVSAAVENDRLQPSLAWTRNDTLGGLGYNHSISLFRSDRRTDSVTTTQAHDLTANTLLLAQRDTGVADEVRQGLNLNGRLQWRGEGGETATLSPLLIYNEGSTRRDGRLEQSVGSAAAPYELAHSDGEGSFGLLRMNGQWSRRIDEAGRLELRGGAGRARFAGRNLRTETSAGSVVRTLADETTNTEDNASINGKFSSLLGDGEHNVVGGAELEANQRVEAKTTLQNGTPLLADFGDNLSARSSRFALYLQDEWSVSPQWAVHAGLRGEGITTRAGATATAPALANTSRVWSPLVHLLWKPDPAGRDQIRASLTRSYRSPSLSSLMARPNINTRYAPPLDNTPTQPDRAGNPNLRPELATGLDFAYEHYLPAGGLLSANVFQRRISDYMRSVTNLETVSWAAAPRYVSRTHNVGNALTRGLELEAKFRLGAVFDGAPAVDIRSNASLFSSRVEGVPGPDNRIDQQPDWTANLGADYRFPGTPLMLGGNLNLTPGYMTQVSAEQTARVNGKIVGDAYALWIFSPTFQARLTASNVQPRDYITGSGLDYLNASTNAPQRETSQTVAPTYLNVQLRLEFKL